MEFITADKLKNLKKKEDNIKEEAKEEINDSIINSLLFNMLRNCFAISEDAQENPALKVRGFLYIIKEQQRQCAVNYNAPLLSYSEKLKKAAGDFTNNIPLKKTEILPESLAGSGFYGYTILGWNYMVRIRDLHPDKAYETDVHELIHTDDEYETRVIVRWMLSGDKEEKYKT